MNRPLSALFVVCLFVGCENSAPQNSQSSIPSAPTNQSEDPARDNVTPDPTQETPAALLSIGDTAPAIAPTMWFKGEPITAFTKDSIYVVEFWATWCPPCLESMPHLSALQTKYADEITIIGISGEEQTTVERFLDRKGSDKKTWRERITYAIALDGQQTANEQYMSAAGQDGIPTAFIVGRSGRIEWIGSPFEIDDPLDQIVNGSWDLQAAREKFEADRKQAQLIANALEEFEPSIEAAESSGDWSKPLKIVAALIEAMPDEMPFQVTRLELLNKAKQHADFDTAATALTQSAWDVPDTLESIAWTIAAEQTHAGRNLSLALKAARRANELTKSQNASILDTLARVYFESGDLDRAIEAEEKAVALEPDNPDWNDVLERYEKKKLGIPTDDE